MNEQFLDEYEKTNAKIKKETGKEVPTLVIEAVLTLTPFVKAVRAINRGEYTRALCFLAIWSSFKTTSENAYTRHTIKRHRAGL